MSHDADACPIRGGWDWGSCQLDTGRSSAGEGGKDVIIYLFLSFLVYMHFEQFN